MNRRKKIVFSLLMALLPIVILILLELVLRGFGAFRQEPFILETTHKGKEYYQFNQWVAKRYFDPRKVSVPGLHPEKFLKAKTSKTFRIVCLGGSTTAGFPFDCQVPFPVQLRYLLTHAYPDYQFEVLNAGISAVNSFTVLDLLPDILAASPDLILIYMGHNEFYGAYGSASTVSIGQNGRLIRFYLKLQKLHLVQMLKRAVSALRTAPEIKPGNKTLMAGVIRDQEIPLGSEKYRATLSNFEDNLNILLAACVARKVPVILSNLVSNIRDLPPFASAQPQTASAVVVQEHRDLMAAGDQLMQSENYVESATFYHNALTLDSTAANLWYKLGQAYLTQYDSAAARYFLMGAKDRDVIRFRASEQVNQVIAAAAARHKASLVDMQQMFAARSAQGLIGNNIMVDHLHPDPNGYYLMAKTFYDAINASGLLRQRNTNFAPEEQPYFVTDLDWDIGRIKIFEMIHRWPFPEKAVTLADYQPHGDPAAAGIARDYLFVDNVWSRAHYKMAENYVQRQDYSRARREYLAVSVYAPDDPYPYQQVAKTYEIEKNWNQREAFLQKVLPLSEQKGMILYQIALAQWQQKNFDAACQFMAQALNHPDLNRAEKQNARFYLAGFYADAQNVDMAKRVLVTMLEEDPGFQPARVFLQRLSATHE
ncbi:hypothetical protein KJ068_15215 [bacterium]|nr:hypothetical protein [bacterium]